MVPPRCRSCAADLTEAGVRLSSIGVNRMRDGLPGYVGECGWIKTNMNNVGTPQPFRNLQYNYLQCYAEHPPPSRDIAIMCESRLASPNDSISTALESQAKWNRATPIIQDLYLREDLTARVLQRVMEVLYDFKAR